MDYAQGWPAVAACAVTRPRLLPDAPGQVLVQPDEVVQPGTIVAHGAAPLFAGLAGRILRVFPERGVLVQGMATAVGALAGWGGLALGPLTFAQGRSFPPASPFLPGSLLIVPGELTIALAQSARAAGVSGIIAASAHPATASALGGAPISSLLDGSAPSAAGVLPVALIHGFGACSLAAALWQLLGARVGQPAMLNATTDVVHGIHPELLIPLPPQAAARVSIPDCILQEGAFVWINGGEADGASGRIVALLTRAVLFPSGIRAPAARVRLDSGAEILVPQANIQRVG